MRLNQWGEAKVRTGPWEEGQRDTKADLGYHCQGQRFSRLHYKSSTWGFPSMTSFSIDFYDLGVETLNCNPSPQEAETKGLNLDCTVRFSQEYKIKGQWDDSAGKSTCTLPEDLHLIHGTYKVEGENQQLKVVLWPQFMYIFRQCTHRPQKLIFKKKKHVTMYPRLTHLLWPLLPQSFMCWDYRPTTPNQPYFAFQMLQKKLIISLLIKDKDSLSLI